MSSTSTTTIMATSSTSTSLLDSTETSDVPFMLPGMSSPEQPKFKLQLESGERVVRFDRECVLIPESPKLKKTMVVTRSYSLPLWKKRGRSGNQQHPQGFESDVGDVGEEHTGTRKVRLRPPSPDNASSRVVLKVPIPTFRRRSSRSPARGRSVSTSPLTPNRLTPCLVHRDPSSSPEIPSKFGSSHSASLLSTRPSLPIYHKRKDDVTIPLRECCHACERITEECLNKGELWHETFSREAKKRRSASWDYQCSMRNRRTAGTSNGNASAASVQEGSTTGPVMADVDEATDLEDDPPLTPSSFSITVDEVDKRRKSLERPSTPPPRDLYSAAFGFEVHGRDGSTSSTASSNFGEEELRMIPDLLDPRHHLHQGRHKLVRSSPIEEEEDEAQLFPLPKRTPSSTPSPKVSPSPSPNGSTACLPAVFSGASAAARSSKESVGSNSSSQESLLRVSLSRKPLGLGVSNGDRGGLPFPTGNMRNMSPRLGSPLACSEGSSSGSKSSEESVEGVSPAASQPLADRKVVVSMSTTDSSVSAPVPPPNSSKHRRASSLSASASSPMSMAFDASGSQQQRPDAKNAPLPPLPTATSEPSSPPSSKSLKLHTSPNLPASPSLPSSSPSTSPSAKRRLSLTVPFNKVSKVGGAIRDVSVDVLKGVSSMSSGVHF